MKAGKPALQLIHITKVFGKVVALDDVNLEVTRGELLTVLGPSGSGKSTLLKIVGGFEDPTRGEVYINGELMNGVPPYKRPTSMVFQDLALFPHLNVFDNIAYGLKVRKTPSAEIRRKVREAAELLHIEDLLDRRVTQLSGGQQQRVALARSLVLEPEILLLDEPLGPLDLKLRREMQLELRRVQRELKATWIYVTHDHEEAMTMSDRVAIIRSGKLLAVGSIKELYERPRSRFVAEFMGDVNFFDGKVEKVEGEAAVISSDGVVIEAYSPSPLKEGQRTLVMIRPEKIRISRESVRAATNTVRGRVVEKVYKGFFTDLKIETGQGKALKVRVQETDVNVGDEVYLTWKGRDAVVVGE